MTNGGRTSRNGTSLSSRAQRGIYSRRLCGPGEPSPRRLDRSQIPVQPVEDLLDHRFDPGRDVPSLEDEVALVLLRRAEQAKERILSGLDRMLEVLASAEQKHRDLDAGGEIDHVDLRRIATESETSRQQDRGFESLFDRDQDNAVVRAEAQPVVGELAPIDVRTGTQIIE